MPERALTYESINNKKHSGFIVTAPSWQRLYIDSALALTDLLVDLDLIKEIDKKTVEACGETKETLMVSLLNEVSKLFDTEKFLAHRVVFNTFDGKKITASLFGETYHNVRHGYASDIKSIHEKIVEMGESKREENQFYAKVEIKN